MATRNVLAYAVRGETVLKYLGELLIGVAVMAAVPALAALTLNAIAFAIRCGFVSAAVLGIALLLRRRPGAPDLQVNEALVVTALTFLVGAGVMVWPLMADGLAVWDAVFESVSALTTTGLTTIGDIEARSPAFLFTRAWMQWYGGLVIVVLAVTLVIQPGPATKRLVDYEASQSEFVGSARARVRLALVVYLSLLVAGAFLLWLFGLDAFDAILHSLASVSTGGFSSRNDSIAGFGNLAVQITVIGLALCAAVSLSLYPRRLLHGWSRLAHDPDVRALVVVGFIVTAALAATLMIADGRTAGESLRQAPLLAFSAQTTSGFEAARVADLSPASKAVLMVSMFIGGDLGSTAGGIKIVRFLLVLHLVKLVLQQTCLPRHAVVSAGMRGQELRPRELIAMLAVVILFVLVIALSWLPFLLLGHDPLDSLFEVVSAVGTVGLSSGIVGSGLPVSLKALLCFDMFMGRLEIVALLVLFYPRTWFGRRATTS